MLTVLVVLGDLRSATVAPAMGGRVTPTGRAVAAKSSTGEDDHTPARPQGDRRTANPHTTREVPWTRIP
ncbi:hypothetical protein GCM10029964_060060 [Kibdelosporangium lantanae]